jgi:hypothetical protein
MNKTLYFKLVNGNDHPYSIEDYREIIKAIDKRRYFLDRLVGHVNGSFDGKFKNTDIKLIESITDYLISNDLVNLEKVEHCHITQKK